MTPDEQTEQQAAPTPLPAEYRHVLNVPCSQHDAAIGEPCLGRIIGVESVCGPRKEAGDQLALRVECERLRVENTSLQNAFDLLQRGALAQGRELLKAEARAEQAEKATKHWQSRAEVAEHGIDAAYHLISEIDREGGDAPHVALGIIGWIKGRHEMLKAAEARAERLQQALEFYANPDTYFAIGIFPDSPCGDFIDDFSVHGYPDYPEDDERPGKRARAAWERQND